MTPDPDSLLDPIRLEAVILEATRCAQFGDLAEFGVYKGGTAVHLARIAKAAGRKLHLFDSWQGLSAPTLPTERNLAGALASPKEYCVEKLRAADVLDCCRFHDGDICVYQEGMVFQPERLAFAHVDLDMSAPTELALHQLDWTLLGTGSAIVDDYGNDKFSGVTHAVNRLKELFGYSIKTIGEPPKQSVKLTFK